MHDVKYDRYIPVLAYNYYGYHNHLILLRTAEKLKECYFIRDDKITESFIFFHVEKDWKENFYIYW